MKKSIIFTAIVISLITILISGTHKYREDTCVYLIYNGGTQKALSSYSQTLTEPAECPGSETLCWFRICDENGIISIAEFNEAFEDLDNTNTLANSLDDEPEIPGVLEKKE